MRARAGDGASISSHPCRIARPRFESLEGGDVFAFSSDPVADDESPGVIIDATGHTAWD